MIEGLWNCVYSASFRIVSEKSEEENSIGTICDCVINQSSSCRGFNNFITFEELMELSNGFYNRKEDKVTLTIDIITDEPKVDKFILNHSNSKGTIFMDIQKVSEFAREIFLSERKSETVHIKGLPWKIKAQIQKKTESTNNEKYLGIYLLCDAPEEDKKWNCKCSATFFDLSRKMSGVTDMKREFSEERTFNSESRSWGFYNLISFAKLMNPSEGFYDKSEDKVTLTIDFTVNEAKNEDKA
ncbi:hypothetical protein niasHS_012763 [Heterodera schachtii]|uniref:MATH domain-containing protein n=1 Tax=Heterodera schachtii TaxID=97005 RepID=A0ABD2IWD7_HETSC